MSDFDQVSEAAAFVQARLDAMRPRLGIVLERFRTFRNRRWKATPDGWWRELWAA
jgi:hypothetical protein